MKEYFKNKKLRLEEKVNEEEKQQGKLILKEKIPKGDSEKIGNWRKGRLKKSKTI